MITSTALRAPREILFGSGQRRSLGRVARRFGNRALVCTDARLAGDPLLREMVDDLRRAGLEVQIDAGVEPDVPRDSCVRAAGPAREFRPDLVIGIGGGSCLDYAKCVALLVTHGGSPEQYYGEFKVPGPVLPVIAMPTTAGTGSEATPVAVLSDPDKIMKVGISSPHLIPQVAICDPELTVTCPPGLTAVTGADALTHAIEAFMAVRREPSPDLALDRVFIGKTEMTDFLALKAISLINGGLERACRNGSDLEARTRVMMGALYAGLAFGTAGTAAAHAIQYPIGTLTHTAHGLGVASMLPYVMAYNRSVYGAELAEVGRAMGLAGAGEAELGERTIRHVATLFRTIGIPVSLAELGLPRDRLEWVGTQALTVDRLIKNNPRPLDAASMDRLLQAAYAGDLASVD